MACSICGKRWTVRCLIIVACDKLQALFGNIGYRLDIGEWPEGRWDDF